MPDIAIAENPFDILKARLERGVNATALCIAITGWIADVPTNPSVADIHRSADGDILLRLSDEASAEPLCSFFEFLKEVRVICQSFGLSESQTARVATEVRRRLG